MKRAKSTIKSLRRQRNEKDGTGKGNSKYAKKVAAGNQMYGPGCCGHRIRVGSQP